MTDFLPFDEDVLQMAERHLRYQQAYVRRNQDEMIDCLECGCRHPNGLRRPGRACSNRMLREEEKPIVPAVPVRPVVPEALVVRDRRLPGEVHGDASPGFWEQHRKHPVHLDDAW